MAAMRLRLQKELFDETDEQLVALANVTKTDEEEGSSGSNKKKDKKKKKDRMLCLVRTNDVPVYVKVYLLKKSDKEIFKKKQEWQLRELKMVDAVGTESLELRLDLEERYSWEVSSAQEKEAFVRVLQKMCERYNTGRRTKFLNMVKIGGSGGELSARGQGGGIREDEEQEEEAGYQAISDKETADLRALMAGCETAVTAADQFSDRLAKELSVLDGDNIHSMMASEEAVDNLMELLTESIKEVEGLESRLNQYDDQLEHIRDSMEKMEGKTESLETVNENNKKLLMGLDSLVAKLYLSYDHQVALSEADFGNTATLPQTTEAAQALQAAMLAPLPYSLTKMAAVQEQRKRMDRWKEKFSKGLCRHFNNVFVHLGNEPGENLAHQAAHLTMPARTSIHRELLPYSELMHWLKIIEPKSYTQLQKTYTSSLNKLYERDLSRFLEEAYARVGTSGPAMGASQEIIGKKSQKTSVATVKQLLGTDKEHWGVEGSLGERERFDDTLERLLSSLEPVVMAEQNFCISFFKMDSKLSDKSQKSQVMTKAQKQVTEEVRKMMSELFASMETGLVSFLSYFEQQDSLYSMYSYVRLSTHVLQAQDTGSFLAITLGSALIHTKRNFDKLMQAHLRSIEEGTAPKRNKCGIIHFVNNFGGFANIAENIFKSSDRRSDIEKWYMTLISSMIDNIPRIAKEHKKTPQEVVKMENFHHLNSLLYQLKISVLESHRKEIKNKYNDSLHKYVTQYFGRPLDKLNSFFDGVSARINAGVKEAEVSYQLQYSKQELRKVIQNYPGKEVKKGLADLYKKVEKHLSEEENLVQVVWHAMQEEFIRQYKYIEDLMQRCYPGAQISLDFNITDILDYFSDIARLH